MHHHLSYHNLPLILLPKFNVALLNHPLKRFFIGFEALYYSFRTLIFSVYISKRCLYILEVFGSLISLSVE